MAMHVAHEMTTMMAMDGHEAHTMAGGMDMGGHGHDGHMATSANTDNSTCSQACMTMMTNMMHQMSHTPGHSSGHSDAGHYGWFHSTMETIILFEDWTTSSWQAVLYSCIGIFFMGVLYEGIKVLREQASSRLTTSGNYCRRLWHPGHIGLSFLHVIQVFISYLLMLVFMTFNVYLCVAVLAGAFVGYFLFHCNYSGKSMAYEINEHCN